MIPAPRNEQPMTALRQVLEALTVELERTVECGEMLEEYMASLAPLLPKDAALEEMQSVDQLVQSIANLAQFSRAIAANADMQGAVIDFEAALGVVTLNSMVTRLRGLPEPAEQEEATGDVELF
jgi:hypothetical protein